MFMRFSLSRYPSVRRWTKLLVSLMCTIAPAHFTFAQRARINEDRTIRLPAIRETPTFSRIDPIGNGCVMVYGNLSYGGSEFLIQDCGSKTPFRGRKVSIGFVDKMAFSHGSSGWFVISGKLLKARITENENALELTIAKNAPDVRIKDVVFINSELGWLCGAAGTIFKTEDGGLSWKQVQSSTDVELKEIRFFNPQEGWARGSEYRDGKTISVVLITRDGGNSWVSLNKAISMELSPVYLTSLRHGCGIDDDSAVVCTNDLNEWTVSYSDKDTRANKRSIFFLGPNLGWIGGDFIWHTADGGKTWGTQLALPQGTPFPFEQVVFVNEQLGWAQTLTSVWRTTNGGKSWEKISDHWTSRLQ